MKTIFLSIFILISQTFGSNAFCLNTKIQFKLEKGSQLFVSFPESKVVSKQIILTSISRDTSFEVIIESETPFIFLNLNQQSSPYLLYPDNSYFLEVNQGDVDLTFKNASAEVTNEANLLFWMDRNIAKLTVGFENPNFKAFAVSGRYNKELDSLSLLYYHQRMEYLIKNRELGTISNLGFIVLQKCIRFNLISNRFLPFNNNQFSTRHLPYWYADSVMQYLSSFNDTSLINVSIYKAALRGMVDYLCIKKFDNTNLSSKFQTIQSIQLPQPSSDLVYFITMSNRSSMTTENYVTYLDSFNIYCKNENFKNLVNRNYQFFKDGNTSIGQFVLNSSNNKNSLDSLIKNTKGIVVVDFWASWCLPCLEELNNSDIKNEFNGKPIKYLYFSLDQNFNTWKRKLSSFSFMNENNSFIVPNAFEAKIAKANMVETIPRYFLYYNGKLLNNNLTSIHSKDFLLSLEKIPND